MPAVLQSKGLYLGLSTLICCWTTADISRLSSSERPLLTNCAAYVVAIGQSENVLQGKAPSVQAAMDLYHLLGESSTHLRQPVGLETQLLEVDDMDSEVGNSMLQLLQVPLASVLEQH